LYCRDRNCTDRIDIAATSGANTGANNAAHNRNNDIRTANTATTMASTDAIRSNVSRAMCRLLRAGVVGQLHVRQSIRCTAGDRLRCRSRRRFVAAPVQLAVRAVVVVNTKTEHLLCMPALNFQLFFLFLCVLMIVSTFHCCSIYLLLTLGASLVAGAATTTTATSGSATIGAIDVFPLDQPPCSFHQVRGTEYFPASVFKSFGQQDGKSVTVCCRMCLLTNFVCCCFSNFFSANNL
jgi:hypothetical protein